MKHFQPRPSQIKENRYKANQSEAPRPAPPYSLWSISLFKPKPRDQAASCFLSTSETVDPDYLQRCMDLVFPWRVDLYFVSRTVFQIQFKRGVPWRDITRYTRLAFEELV